MNEYWTEQTSLQITIKEGVGSSEAYPSTCLILGECAAMLAENCGQSMKELMNFASVHLFTGGKLHIRQLFDLV